MMSGVGRLLDLLMRALVFGDDRETILGDLSEMYALETARFGSARASIHLLRDLASVTIHRSFAAVAHNRGLHRQMLFGLLAGTLALCVPMPVAPFYIVLIATVMWLATAALREERIASYRVRASTLFVTYTCALLPAFVRVVATEPGAWNIFLNPAAFVRWISIAFPILGGAGVFGSLFLAPFATRRRSGGLMVMALPIVAVAIQTFARPSINPDLFVLFNMTFPISSWGPRALRPWNTFMDLALWMSIAMLVARVKRGESVAVSR
jgi:hypothetical protein